MAWSVRAWLIGIFGRALTDHIVGIIIARLVVPRLGATFCSVFPLRPIVEAPDFDAAVKRATDKYMMRHHSFKAEASFQKWLDANPRG